MFICLVYNTTVTKFCLLSPRTSIYHKDNIKSIKEKLFDMFRGVEPQQEQYKMGIEVRYNMELNNQVKYCHGTGFGMDLCSLVGEHQHQQAHLRSNHMM